MTGKPSSWSLTATPTNVKMPPPNFIPPSSLLKATTAVTAAFPFRPSLLRRSIVTPSKNPESLICVHTSTTKISIERRRRRWMVITPKSWAHTTFAMASFSSSSSSSPHQCQNGIDGSYDDKKKEKHEGGGKSSKMLTLPTVLTLGRVAAVPLLVATFNTDGWWATTATTSIFLGAAITDWLDGYLARKMKLGTAFGAFLDPVADKLMVAATLILICSRPLEVAVFGEIPWLLAVPAIVIIGREVLFTQLASHGNTCNISDTITMSAVREWAASQSSKVLEAVAVNNLGKWKTATQMTALTILLATRDPSLTGQGVLVSSGVGLLYISAWLALWSLVVYMRSIWRVLLK